MGDQVSRPGDEPPCTVWAGRIPGDVCQVAIDAAAELMRGEAAPDGRASLTRGADRRAWQTAAAETCALAVEAVTSVNLDRWRLDLDPGSFYVQVGRSGPGHRLAPHQDPCANLPRRRLVAAVELSPPAGYEGGRLELAGNGRWVAAPNDRGAVTVFPAGTVHRVTELTRGERWVFVGRIDGVRPAVVAPLRTLFRACPPSVPDLPSRLAAVQNTGVGRIHAATPAASDLPSRPDNATSSDSGRAWPAGQGAA